MKLFHPTPLITALALAAVAATGCAKNSNTLASEKVQTENQTAGTDSTMTTTVTPEATSPGPREPASDTWDRIKDDTYEQQADFATGYRQLGNDADAAIQKLDAKRATMTDTAAKDWDIAMKELKDARSDLDDKLNQVKAANSDTWNDAKGKATAAWKRVVDDLDKVRHSTTS
jgi:hypothetical protein